MYVGFGEGSVNPNTNQAWELNVSDWCGPESVSCVTRPDQMIAALSACDYLRIFDELTLLDGRGDVI